MSAEVEHRQRMAHGNALAEYEGYSKSSKTNSKKYFIYEIYKIIFLHSFHPIHKRCFKDGIFRWKHRLQKCYELDGNYVEK